MPRILLATLMVAVATASFAAEPAINHLTATASQQKVSVRFQLEHAFEREETVQGLQSGIPTSFTYVVEIFRDRPNWLDEGIARSRIEVIATFNALTREYLLNYRRDRRLVRSETYSDLAALQQRMTTVDEHDLFDVGTRRPHKLRVRVKADLRKGWLLYFIPWDVSTRWRDARVTTAGASEAKP